MASSATPHLLLYLLFLPLLPILTSSTVTLNSSLSAAGDNSSWLSSSGEFAFGFLQLDHPNTFLLAIWYAKIPDRTIVWQANTTTQIQTGSTVELSPNGLTLSSLTAQTLWTARPNTTVSQGSMLDTGNFVLFGNNDNSVPVWESFSFPTDTLLPNQTLSLGGMLYSRINETNYSKGRFKLRFMNGVELVPLGWPGDFNYNPYYSFGSLSGFDELVFNQTAADIFLVRANGTSVPLSWPSRSPNPLNYHRATLDFDGVFRQYTYPRDPSAEQSWMVVRFIPDDICMDLTDTSGSGACGFNSYCTTSFGTPTCQCPPGYSFMDPNNKFGGCKLDFPLDCGVLSDDHQLRNPETLYELEIIQGLNWPVGDYDILRPYNQTRCQQSCLDDCLCAVAIFDGTTCWKKKLPLANGRLEGGLAIIKKRKAAPPPNRDFDNPELDANKDKQILLWSLFGSSGFFNLLLLLVVSLMIFSRRHQKSRMVLVHDSKNVRQSSNLRVFTFQELIDATQEFKEELGRGSFGTVYKGKLGYDLNNQVAVKKLDRLSPDGEREFRAEVEVIGRTHHKNLVELLGYCEEGPHRLLVYEFMSNGSLANFLFGNPRPDWYQRTQVGLGIARGLMYLHEECNVPIIHCDIKPQNILMDENFAPKISDFGLAKTLMYNQTRTQTGIRGTRGYVALEWFKNAPVSVKVDVYSFGVVLLEIICCRRSLEMEFGEEHRAILTEWAYECYKEGTMEALVEDDEEAKREMAVLRRWLMTALCCVQEDPSRRPTMKMVIQMLEGYVEVPTPICTSTFCLAS